MISVSFDVPINDAYDVIVAGGGAAGCAAAAAAARRGAKILLIEASGFLGGMASGGMVPEFCPYTDGEKIIHHGIAEDVLFQMKAGTPDAPEKLDYCTIDAERMKSILDALVTEAGADVLFYATVCGADVFDGRIRTIYAADKSGIRGYCAPVFVDCTGDADLAAFAGCDFTVGDNAGTTQMPTLCFDMCGIRDEGIHVESAVRKILPQIVADDEFPLIDNTFFCTMKLADGLYGFNAGHVRQVACLDRASVSAGMIEGRKKAQQYRDALKKYMPEVFADAHITATAPLLGVRETRRIAGEYTLTADDYRARRSFPDEIGRNSYAIDLHDPAWFYKNEEVNAVCGKYERGDSHGIPYRCLVPKKIDNLLVAGRCISCERAVQSSVRIIPVCFVTGEAAGCAAAIMHEHGCAARDVDIAELKRALGQM